MGSEEEETAKRVDLLTRFEDAFRHEMLDDPMFQLKHGVPQHFFSPEFSDIWAVHNMAMCNTIIQLRRYIRALRSWLRVVEGANPEDAVVTGIVVDYLWPLLFTASDLPRSMKEEATRGAVRLSRIATNRKLEESKRRPAWHRLFNDEAAQGPERDALQSALETLYDNADAKLLEASHKERHHDIPRPLVGEIFVPEMFKDANGVEYYCQRATSMDWEAEVDLIDRQRHAAQDVYHAFWSYAEMLSNRYVDKGVCVQASHLDMR